MEFLSLTIITRKHSLDCCLNEFSNSLMETISLMMLMFFCNIQYNFSEKLIRIINTLFNSILTVLDLWKAGMDALQRGHSGLWSRLRSIQARQ